MLNDPLASALSTILNAERKSKLKCNIKPISGTIQKVLDIMKEHKYIGECDIKEDGKGNYAELNLIGYINKCGAIKPRVSVKAQDYEKYEKRYLPSKELGIMIISTSQGVMSHRNAIKKNLGGRLIAYCY